MHKPEQVTISSQLGWEQPVQRIAQVGLEEQTMHINSLELLAALLAAQCRAS